MKISRKDLFQLDYTGINPKEVEIIDSDLVEKLRKRHATKLEPGGTYLLFCPALEVGELATFKGEDLPKHCYYFKLASGNTKVLTFKDKASYNVLIVPII